MKFLILLCDVLKFLVFIRDLCSVIIPASADAVDHFFESAEMKLFLLLQNCFDVNIHGLNNHT